MEENEHLISILIENDLYVRIKSVKKTNKGKEADELIEKYIEEFKKTVLKRYPVEDIDGLVESVLKRLKEYDERNSR